MEILNVKVGDKVLVSKGSRYKNNDFIVEVEKVTPTGMIKLSRSNNPLSFNKYGKQIGSAGYFPYRLSIPTEEDYKRIEKNKFAGKILHNISLLNVDNLYDKDINDLKILKAAVNYIQTTDAILKEEKFNEIIEIYNKNHKDLFRAKISMLIQKENDK
jgi:hypothetical protein